MTHDKSCYSSLMLLDDGLSMPTTIRVDLRGTGEWYLTLLPLVFAIAKMFSGNTVRESLGDGDLSIYWCVLSRLHG